MFKLLSNKKFQLALIAFLIFAAYFNTLSNQFTADEVGYVLNWQAPKHIENVGRILTTESVPPDEAGVYRPIKSLFIMLSWHLWDAKPFGYHLDGILLHIANTFLVYLIAAQLVHKFKRIDNESERMHDIRRNSFGISSYSYFLPFLTALLFGLHPIQTEAITLLTSSFDSLGWTFYLGSMAAYLHSRIRTNGVKIWFVVSVVLAGLAFFTYELTLSLPLILILTDLLRIRTDRKKSNVRGQLSIVRYVPYFLILGFYLIVRFLLLHTGVRGTYLGDSFYKTQLVMTFAWVKYLWLFIWPVNLSIDHKLLPGVYSVVYKAYVSQDTLDRLSFFSPQVIGNLGILGVLVGLGVYFWRRLPIVAFCIFWFFVALSPAAFILPQSTILAERYGYMAAFGFCLLAAYFSSAIILRVKERKRLNREVLDSAPLRSNNIYRRLMLTFVGFLVVGYGLRTYVRNFDYHDTLTFWQKLASQSPDNAISNYTLAKIYEERGNHDLALLYFERALLDQPGIVEVNFRIGKIYEKLNKVDVAARYFSAAQNTENKYSTFAAWNLERIQRLNKAGQNLASYKDTWDKYQLEGLSFEYPKWWLVSRSKRSVIFDDPTTPFSVEFSQDQLAAGQSPQTYVVGQKEVGTVLRTSQATIDHFDGGYAQFFKDDDVERLEFFLFKRGQVVRIWVYPANSYSIGEFDRMLGTIESQ